MLLLTTPSPGLSRPSLCTGAMSGARRKTGQTSPERQVATGQKSGGSTMPRKGAVYDIFLSSPSDVNKEREIVEKVVGALNREFVNHDALCLNLMRWETGAFSGIGRDP